MRCKDNTVKRCISLSILVFMLVACTETETFQYYSFDFYPVEDMNNSGTWIETDFLSGDTLAFQLNSLRILEEYHDFEPIDISTCNLIMDKAFITNCDTINPGDNLLTELDNAMISFSQHIGEYGKEYSWYYLIISSTELKQIKLPDDFYQFNINGETTGGYTFNDSIFVRYNKNQ